METMEMEIEIQDNFTGILYSVMDSVSMTAAAIDGMGGSMGICFDATAIRETQISINATTAAVEELDGKLGSLSDQVMQKALSYVNMENIGKILDISDDLTMTIASLDRINDGMQSTQELTNMVYEAAQDARCSFGEMADAVAAFGDNAGDAFDSSQEAVAFAALVQKQLAVDGAGPGEASDVIQQLSAAFGADMPSGDALERILGQAPGMLESIAGYLDVPADRISEMASQGMISADMLKAAVFANADEINARFDQMPVTWDQAFQSLQNSGLLAFQPVLQRVNDLANSEDFQTFADGAAAAMAVLADIILRIFDVAAMVGSFFVDHWSVIGPVIYGVIAAMAAYLLISGVVAMINGVIAVSNTVRAAADSIAAGATFLCTAAQTGWNAALAACPLTWIILLIIALVAILYAVCAAIAKATGIADSGFGVIAGGVNVVLQLLKNLLLVSLNVTFGIWNAVAAYCGNIKTTFHNVLCCVQVWWYDLLSTALSVVARICEALNRLPFVEFDYSALTSAAEVYAGKAKEAAGNLEATDSVVDAFREGYGTFDTFEDGWAADAFAAGAAWGDGVADAVGSFRPADLFGGREIPEEVDYTSGLDGRVTEEGFSEGIRPIGDSTGSMADSMEVTQEDLKYLRDIAEQETINRYTLTEVNIDQSGMQNTIRNGGDLDGFVSGLTNAFMEAVEITQEGVHG